MLEQYSNQCEYAFYMRGLIARIEGELEEALSWFNKALAISANATTYLVNIGRIYFLMGNHTLAVEYLEKAVKADPTDLKAYYWLARAIYHLNTDLFNTCEKARDLLLQAPGLQTSIELIIFLAKLMAELGDTTAAIQAYERALQLEPENLDVMFKMGMQYLRNNSEDPAFAMFGKALSYQSSHQQSILAAGSIMQAHGDHDVALNKYRVAVEGCDYNGCLWNNIGICLFAKGRLAQAHSCLKKASFICPLDYKINYNLGLVHQAMGLHCSALHFLKAAAELKRDNAQIIGAMAVVLSNMNDINNARRAYEKSISMEPKAEVILNSAIFEYRQKNRDIAREALTHFKTISSTGGCRKDLLSKADQLDDALLSLPHSSDQQSA
nr:Tetratricopeptide TPR2 and Tetratricopeptide TPR-1 domain containing protein [Haemonchus contortus]